MSGVDDDVAIYFGELIFAIALAMMLLAASTLEFSIAILLFCCSLVVWTLAECIYSLLCVACHCSGPARDSPRPDRQDLLVIWFALVVYLTTRGAILAGVLVAYAWYLSILRSPQSCNSSGFLAEASPRQSQTCDRNDGVATKVWDRAFGTKLR